METKARLRDGTEVIVRRARDSDEKWIKDLTVEMDNEVGLGFVGDSSKMIMWMAFKAGELDILVAEKEGEGIGFVMNRGIDRRDECGRSKGRTISHAATIAGYRKKGVNKCLLMMTLATRREGFFHIPLISKTSGEVLKMIKKVASEARMRIKVEEAGNGQYGIDLIRSAWTEKAIREALRSDFGVEI